MSTDAGDQQAGRYRPGRGARILGWSLLAIALLLLVLPEIIRFALIKYLPDTGIGEVAIKDVDLNLFNASAGIEGLVISREGKPKLELDSLRLDANWLKLLVGQYQIDSIAIDGLRLAARQGQNGGWEVVMPLPTGGESTESAEPASEPLTLPKVLLRELSLSNVEVDVESPVISGAFGIDKLHFDDVSSWLQSPATLDLRGSWRGAPLTLALSVSPWIDIPEASGKLVIEALPLQGIRGLDGGPLQGKVSTDLTFSARRQAGTISADLRGNIAVAGLQAVYKKIALGQDLLSWKGQVRVSLPGNGNEPTFGVSGDLNANGLSVEDQQQGLSLLRWQSLAVSHFSLDQDLNAGFDKLQLAGADALGNGAKNQGFYTGAFDVSGARLVAGNRLHIDEAVISKGRYNLEIARSGKLQVESVLSNLASRFESDSEAEKSEQASAPAATSAPTPAADEKPAAFVFGIDKVRVQDKTRINLVDRRFSPPVEQALTIDKLALDKLDQEQPDQDTQLSLQATVGEFSSLSVQGDARPFAANLSADVKGELDAMELPAISPYAEAYLGYELTRGQYDHKFKVHVADGKVDLKNKLTLRQLKLKAVDPDKPQPIEKQLDVPLGLALDMLRDRDDNIELDVPIKGRLDDPSVNIHDVINDALANALRNGATSYLKYALQPYGAILMAADFVGEQMSAVRLQPMVYAAGSDAVPDQQDYVKKLQGLLQQRPQLQLTLCGGANAADRTALFGDVDKTDADKTDKEGEDDKQASEKNKLPPEQETALKQLADRRAKNLKRVFMEKGVASKRLLLCQARYAADGVSGVQLGM